MNRLRHGDCLRTYGHIASVPQVRAPKPILVLSGADLATDGSTPSLHILVSTQAILQESPRPIDVLSPGLDAQKSAIRKLVAYNPHVLRSCPGCLVPLADFLFAMLRVFLVWVES